MMRIRDVDTVRIVDRFRFPKNLYYIGEVNDISVPWKEFKEFWELNVYSKVVGLKTE